MKRAQLEMLLRVRKLLTGEQRTILTSLRGRD
jgi:hypothetical protein